MDANRLPCIPYLGLFLTDLSFVYEVPGKRGQVDSICNTIAYFQNSTYGGSVVTTLFPLEEHIVHVLCTCMHGYRVIREVLRALS